MSVRVVTSLDVGDWAQMRHELWPTTSAGEHDVEIDQILRSTGSTLNLIARAENGYPAGFAEASIRHDHVNGCDTSPVAFVEGIYVRSQYRRLGFARELVSVIEAWAQGHGCSELASDADIANVTSHAMHAALGFGETQRVVYFRKVLLGS